MTTLIDMVEQNNARLIAQHPSTDQLCERLAEVTEELGGAYRTVERLRGECQRALGERDEARRDRDLIDNPIAFEAHERCDADLEAQKRATRNARRGELIAGVAALVFAALAIVLALN